MNFPPSKVANISITHFSGIYNCILHIFLKNFKKKTKNCGTYYLATVEGDQPRVRPFGTIDLFEEKLYIQTGKSKEVSKQIVQNPKVEICAFVDGKWLRIACSLIRDDRIEAKEHMLDAYPNLKGMYSATDDNTEVLYMKDVTATFSSFTEPPKTVRF